DPEKCLGTNVCHLSFVMQRQLPVGDDVNVGLQEFSEPALLRPFPAPHFLNLVPLEGKVQFSGVLGDVAREWNGQVTVQSEGVVHNMRIDILVEPAKKVYLLGGFSFGQ